MHMHAQALRMHASCMCMHKWDAHAC